MKNILFSLDKEIPEIFLDLEDLVPGEGDWDPSLTYDGYNHHHHVHGRDIYSMSHEELGTLVNGHDVAYFFTDMGIEGMTFRVSGVCCHEDVGRFIVGCRGGFSGDYLSEITPEERSEVEKFCEKHGLKAPGFLLNSEECYRCGN